MGYSLAQTMWALAGFGLTWLAQSTVLLILGLAAGRLLKSSGPAVQSAVYRTALVAVLVCPVVSALLAGMGYEGLTLRLSSPVLIARSEPRVTPSRRPWFRPRPPSRVTFLRQGSSCPRGRFLLPQQTRRE
jgi:hypothetical protein